MPDTPTRTGCYVYGVVAAEDAPDEECLGVDDARVEFLRSGDLAAVVSLIEADREVTLRADLRAHTRVLDWLAVRATVVPLAFGTVTDDSASVVADLLEPGAAALADTLARLRGSAQFNLRGIYHRDRILSELVLADSDLTELHRRTRDLPQGQFQPELIRLGEGVSYALERQRTSDRERVVAALAPSVADLRDRVGGDMDRVFDVAMLVPDSQRAQVEATLEEIAESEHERMRLQLTGPFPPYDFVEATSWVC